MVHILIGLRRTIARHQLAATHPASLVLMLALGVATVAGTLVIGWASYPDPATAFDVIALTSALWIGGRLAQSAVSGEPVLRPELFSLLPVSRRRLGWSLLVVGLLDPANVFLAAALAAVIPAGARLGAAAAAVAVVSVLLAVVLTSIGSTVVAGLLGPGSGRGHDAGTVVTAVLISLLAVAGTLLPTLITALRNQSAPLLSDLLRALPSGWGPAAVQAAGRSDLALTALPLAGLVLAGVVTVAAWPAVLRHRMQGRQPRRRGPAARRPGRRMLGSAPVAAVIAKELRLWLRDPVRLTCLVIALVVGTAVCVLPRVTANSSLLMPFGGAMTVVIAGACACNLYGNDGSSLFLTVLTPGSARADVRGRQLAWLIAVAPYAIVSTVILTAASGQTRYWPWALALLPALLGGGAGLAAWSSARFVQPLDEAGNPTPAFSLLVHIALVAVAGTALPPLLVLLAGGGWAAVPVGVLSGLVLGGWLSRRAVARLQGHEVAMLTTLARAAA